MSRHSNFDRMVEANTSAYITVNGVKMTMVEYNKQIKAKKAAAKKKKIAEKNLPYIKMLPPVIKKMIKGLKQMKSLVAFHDNGYRQWGRVITDILNINGISGPYAHFIILEKEIRDKMEEIEKIGKKNDKDIFQYIEKLAFLLDDAKITINTLMEGVAESGVCEQYKDKECIFGNGRRLGLKTLMSRSYSSSVEMSQAVQTLLEISIQGADVSTYNVYGSFSRF